MRVDGGQHAKDGSGVRKDGVNSERAASIVASRRLASSQARGQTAKGR
jgi:hypothetical protein